MRYAVISDIHGNLEAFRAVLDALSSERIDEYLFVGDVVGYGADPRGCIKLLKSLNPAVLVAGNHEWGALGLKELEFFNDSVRQSVSWTKNALDKEDAEYIKSFRLVWADDRMTAVHGTLNSPEEFYYLFDTDDAYVTMHELRNSLCFIGHTHVPGIFIAEDGRIRSGGNGHIRLDRDKKYVINAGSIGQPRDGDPRASYAIYDDEEAFVRINRVEYDVKKAQAAILKSGLPPKFADRLAQGR